MPVNPDHIPEIERHIKIVEKPEGGETWQIGAHYRWPHVQPDNGYFPADIIDSALADLHESLSALEPPVVLERDELEMALGFYGCVSVAYRLQPRETQVPGDPQNRFGIIRIDID